MAGRIFSTLAAPCMAAAVFCDAGPPPAGINLPGVLFLFVAFVIWFEREAIREGYSFLRENRHAGNRGSDLMLVRMGPPARRVADRGRR
jgi:hypothetical protein